MNALSVLSFQESHQVRVVLVGGDPWFVALDVIKALKLTNPTMALKSLDDDERAKFN
uniref:BRO-N domain-containing protein n=1 Tax=Enterobacter hormaechei TaxID=158836 RepID=UPI0023EE5ADA